MTPNTAPGFKRVVDALRERDGRRLAALAVVDIVQVQRRDRGVGLRDDTGGRELAVHGLHVAESIVARLLGRREASAARRRTSGFCASTLPLGPTAADSTSVNQPPTANTSMTVSPVLIAEELHGLDRLAGGIALLVLGGPVRRQERRLHARHLLVLCLRERAERLPSTHKASVQARCRFSLSLIVLLLDEVRPERAARNHNPSGSRAAAPSRRSLEEILVCGDGPSAQPGRRLAAALLEPDDAARRLQRIEVERLPGCEHDVDPIHRRAARAIDDFRLEAERAHLIAPAAHAADLAEHTERDEVAAVAVRE